MMNGYIYALIAVLIIQSELHRFERKDMLNRLMSRDYKEYRHIDDKPISPKSAHRKVINNWRHKKPMQGGEKE